MRWNSLQLEKMMSLYIDSLVLIFTLELPIMDTTSRLLIQNVVKMNLKLTLMHGVRLMTKPGEHLMMRPIGSRVIGISLVSHSEEIQLVSLIKNTVL